MLCCVLRVLMQSMRDFIYLQSLFVRGVVVPGVVVIAVASFRYTVVRESSTGNWQHLLAGLDDRARFFQIFVISVFTVCRMYMIIIFGMISTLIRWYSRMYFYFIVLHPAFPAHLPLHWMLFTFLYWCCSVQYIFVSRNVMNHDGLSQRSATHEEIIMYQHVMMSNHITSFFDTSICLPHTSSTIANFYFGSATIL